MSKQFGVSGSQTSQTSTPTHWYPPRIRSEAESAPAPRRQPVQELPVYSAEAAVAEHANDIAALHVFRHVIHNCLHVRQVGRRFAGCLKVLHQTRGIEP